MAARPIEDLVEALARLPGLGPRSALRATLHLLKNRATALPAVVNALEEAARSVRPCGTCNALDVDDPCGICADPERDGGGICVVADVGDAWALERTRSFEGRYHVLGGVLNALDGVGPDDLAVAPLVARASAGGVREVILALPATLEGQATAHYVAERLAGTDVKVTRPAHGLPIGGEIDYLDEGTLGAALRARRPLEESPDDG